MSSLLDNADTLDELPGVAGKGDQLLGKWGDVLHLLQHLDAADLTRRFDRVEAALEKMLDLDLPDWAQAEVAGALHYAECAIEDRDDFDERRLCDTASSCVALRAADDGEWDSTQDDTQNDYAGEEDNLDEKPDPVKKQGNDDRITCTRRASGRLSCPCAECEAWRVDNAARWSALPTMPLATAVDLAARVSRPVFGDSSHVMLARQKASQR